MHSENKPNIRIVMLVASLPPLPAGGAELQALKLGKELKAKGVSVLFLTPGKGTVKGETQLQGMPVFRLYSLPARLFNLLSTLKKSKSIPAVKIEYNDQQEVTNEITGKVGLATKIYYTIFYWHCLWFLWPRRKSFDIIHAHTMEWSAIVAAKLGKRLQKPVVVKDSTMNGFQSLSRYPSGEKLMQLIINRIQFVAMTKVIEGNLIQSGVPRNRIERIPNGMDVVKSTKAGNKPTNIDQQVLFVGNLYQQPAKGIDLLLKAWPAVLQHHPQAQLQIVGDGVSPAYLEFAARLGIQDHVHFAGKQTDLSSFYNEAAVFVLPSRREGMSNALMEAMLHGLPCVATDISGSQDLITNGVTGVLVPPVNMEELAKGIIYLLSHPEEAKAMGLKGRDIVVEKFDIRVVAEQYRSLYTNLLSKQPNH